MHLTFLELQVTSSRCLPNRASMVLFGWKKNHNCCPEDNLILASLDLNNMHTGHCPFVGMWFQNIIMV